MNKLLIKTIKAGAIIPALGLLLMAVPVGAHVDPVGCFSNGVGLSLAVYRADGITPVAAGTVQSGETIKYEATLSYLGGTNCYFEGGTLTITTPDGVGHVVASGGGIPLVTTTFVAPQQSYVVDESDVAATKLPASAVYVGGVSHQDGDDQTAGANTNLENTYQDVALEVTKTATPAFDRTHSWTIDKSVDIAVHNLLNGQSDDSIYEIVVDKTTVDSNYTVSGTITIHNPALFATAVITGVADSVSGVGVMTVNCPVAFPYNLLAGQDLICTYSGLLPDSATRTNTATASTSGDVNGDSGDASVDFTEVNPNVIGLNQITVDDTNNSGDFGPVSSDTTHNYSRTFTCGIEQGQFQGTNNQVPNTATIVETQQSNDALVVVNCVEPLVIEKTATTSYNKDWDWTIEKSADQTELELQDGESFTVNYEVEVTPSSEDINHVVSGTVTITNPVGNPDVQVTSVTDMLDSSGAVTLVCDQVAPVTLSGGESINCTYSKNVVGKTDTENKVTVTTDNQALNGSDTAAVVWGQPNNITDECVTVNDDNVNGPQGVVICENDADKTIEYSIVFGPDSNQDADVVTACDDDFDHINNADFVTNDNQEVGQDDWTVHVVVDCFQGCTLTQGYWKTHNASHWGGAPDDPNWANIGNWDGDGSLELEDETLAWGMTWFNVFTTPVKGRVWYQLAHQWMAAYLNSFQASVPADVQDALDDGWVWLMNNSPSTKKSTQASTWASLLGSYNEGLIGPGHCDEQNPPL